MRDVLARHVPPGSRLLLALSGGLDSTTLLHILAPLRSEQAFELAAVHVHHGLSPNADAWADFCTRLCAAHEVPLRVEHVQVDRADPAGIEAAARRERHRAFERCEADFLLTAHHLDDQAETFLLQALRGAGPRGLAAMAECQHRSGERMVRLRPLLGVSRADLLEAARAAGLAWVEDESNLDTRYRRNALRQEILPRLALHVPAAATTLARAAAHQAEAAALLDELARLDAREALDGERLDCTALARLTPARARNLLRHFIAGQGVRLPGVHRLDEALRQLTSARVDARVCVELGGAQIRRYRGGAYVVPAHTLPEPMVWRGEAELCLAGLGTLRLREAVGQGLRKEALQAGVTVLVPRSGGERVRLASGGPLRSLKTLLQARAVPPWTRDRVAVLRQGDAVLWVSGFGCNADWVAGAGEPGWVPVWHAKHA
ncbi:MAG: tRNA lysidine(34) synthetase TilS [Pseudomonadota bacterium]